MANTSTVLQIITTATTVVFALWSIIYNRVLTARIQMRDIGKSNAINDVYFLYEATPKVYSVENKKLIEIEIKVTNKSANKLGILAIFVRFRPIINSNNSSLQNIKSFDDLKPFEDGEMERRNSLTEFRNAAFAKDFIWQTSVDGVSVRRTFDIIEEEFCQKYPLVMAQIMIMGGAMAHIDKTHFPVYAVGKLRRSWVDYVAKKNSEGYNFFSRMGKEGYSKGGRTFRYLDRILTHKDGTFDFDNTCEFEPILQSIINSNIERVIDLRTTSVDIK